MRAARALGAADARVLCYADSGAVSGDTSAVVGYLRGGVRHVRGGGLTGEEDGVETQLSAEDRAGCWPRPARAVADALAGRPPRRVEPAGMLRASSRRLRLVPPRRRSARLHRAPRRRSAAGHRRPGMRGGGGDRGPAFHAGAAGRAAAVRDRDLRARARSPRCTIPARSSSAAHGLIVEQGWRRGLLLPQVAIEYGWDREAFLARTCGKAGLPPDAWKRGATDQQVRGGGVRRRRRRVEERVMRRLGGGLAVAVGLIGAVPVGRVGRRGAPADPRSRDPAAAAGAARGVRRGPRDAARARQRSGPVARRGLRRGGAASLPRHRRVRTAAVHRAAARPRRGHREVRARDGHEERAAAVARRRDARPPGPRLRGPQERAALRPAAMRST